MQIIIAAIGKLKKNAPEAVLIDDYIKKSRLPIVVKELEEKKSLSGEALKTAESKLLCQAIPPGAKIVVLDEGGQTPASRAFAALLQNWREDGVSCVPFLMGGADGHADFLKQKADHKLSFGRMTLPHFLARVVLAEQLYRAKTIWDNHPYHRD